MRPKSKREDSTRNNQNKILKAEKAYGWTG